MRSLFSGTEDHRQIGTQTSSSYTRLTRQKVFRLYKVRWQLHSFHFRFSDNLSVIGSVVCGFWPLDGGSGSLFDSWVSSITWHFPSERTVSESKTPSGLVQVKTEVLNTVQHLGHKATQLGQLVDEYNLNNSMSDDACVLFFHPFIHWILIYCQFVLKNFFTCSFKIHSMQCKQVNVEAYLAHCAAFESVQKMCGGKVRLWVDSSKRIFHHDNGYFQQ